MKGAVPSSTPRSYGGVAIFVSENFLSKQKVQRLKSVSRNSIRLRVEADGWFIIISQFISLQSRARTTRIRGVYLRKKNSKFSIQLPSESICLKAMLGSLQKF